VKKILIGLLLLIAFSLIFGCNSSTGLAGVGQNVNAQVDSPHPYPNSIGDRILAWSETISYPNATYLRLHFSKIEVIGSLSIPTAPIDYGPCDLNAPEGYTRFRIGPNSIGEAPTKNLQIDDNGNIGIIPNPPTSSEGSASTGSSPGINTIKCGVIQEPIKLTPQEMFSDADKYIQGDFVAIKDKNGKVLDIITAEYNYFFSPKYETGYEIDDAWSQTYSKVDTVTIELYTDKNENGYGVSIDKFTRGTS
jgi:hypothetical protein